jgi:hypothetical protein
LGGQKSAVRLGSTFDHEVLDAKLSGSSATANVAASFLARWLVVARGC